MMLTPSRVKAIIPSLRKGVRSFASITPPQVGIVKPSLAEIGNLRLDSRNLEKAVRHMYNDGLVVIEDVVPHEHLDHLNIRMKQDAETLLARGDKSPFNYNKGNIQQDAPPVANFFHPAIFTSKDMDPSCWCWVQLLILHRPDCHPDHLRRLGPSSEMDILLGQLGHSDTSRRNTPTTACSFRCRLQPPEPPLRSRCQCPSRHNYTRERFHRNMARNTQRIWPGGSGGCPWRASQRQDQRRYPRSTSRDITATTARHQEGQYRRP